MQLVRAHKISTEESVQFIVHKGICILLLPLYTFNVITSMHFKFLHGLKKRIPATTNDNFNNSCPIPIFFGTNIAE